MFSCLAPASVTQYLVGPEPEGKAFDRDTSGDFGTRIAVGYKLEVTGHAGRFSNSVELNRTGREPRRNIADRRGFKILGEKR